MEGDKGKSLTIRDVVPKLFSSEALALALLSVLGTVATFFYEYGYLSYYGVPPSLVQINVTRVVLACAAITIVSVVLMAIMLLLLRLGNGRSPVVKAAALPSCFSLLYCSMGFFTGQWKLVLAGSVLAFAFRFLAPFFWQGHAGSYLERLELQIGSPDALLGQRLNFASVLLLVVVGYVLAVMFSGAGQKRAESRELYFMLAEEPTMALVDTYGDVAIFVSYDPETKRMQPLSRTVRLDQPLDLVPAYIGPLLRHVHENGGCDVPELLGFGNPGKLPFECLLRRFTPAP